ncbi:MarR family winged helix-turn-helix transcriptional regulator [Lactovum miscens]|uniref:HTH-type transcriptional regulator SarZ n=1 Tax=Lactovum miscens TaxID=190387 RepID=A0A841CAL8_9LACT|nr:MarR family transcriptional regulator [Lactovum miscens]MBB5888439.1 DNA-binding MarR family transcriptional regulator [Lactovum miscens]
MNELALENQICFPLYAASKGIIKRYKKLLSPLDLTYTQYLVMLVMWEKEMISVRDLGKKICLDSGTLTPLLKKLEQKKYIIRKRDLNDERVLNLYLTDQGQNLREEAKSIPPQVAKIFSLEEEELNRLQLITNKLVRNLQKLEEA